MGQLPRQVTMLLPFVLGEPKSPYPSVGKWQARGNKRLVVAV